jgi:thiol-disulfide isomerase/thioredoxin
VLAVLAALVLALGSGRIDAADLRMDALDQPAPIVGLGDGKTLQDLRGRWVLLHFWATWCHSCVSELPALDQLARRWRDRVDFFAVSIDESDPRAVDAFVAGGKVSIPIVYRHQARASERYFGWGVPVTYLVNPQGRLVGRFLGPRDWAAPGVDVEFGRLTQTAGEHVDNVNP